MAEFKPFEMIMRIEYGGAVNDGDYMQVCCKAKPVSELVRCKDCIHRFVDGENVRFNCCELNHNKVQSDDWYCADGERSSDWIRNPKHPH